MRRILTVLLSFAAGCTALTAPATQRLFDANACPALVPREVRPREQIPTTGYDLAEASPPRTNEMGRMLEILTFAVPLSGWVATPEVQATTVFAPGCGRFSEATAVRIIFGPMPRIVAMDIDKRDIDAARQDLPGGGTYLHGDARFLDRYPLVPPVFDVVWMRHPEVGASLEVWHQILLASVARLRRGGLLITTSLSAQEQDVLALLAGLGPTAMEAKHYVFRRAVTIPNAVPDLAWDGYVSTYRKL